MIIKKTVKIEEKFGEHSLIETKFLPSNEEFLEVKERKNYIDLNGDALDSSIEAKETLLTGKFYKKKHNRNKS